MKNSKQDWTPFKMRKFENQQRQTMILIYQNKHQKHQQQKQAIRKNRTQKRLLMLEKKNKNKKGSIIGVTFLF